MRSLFETVRNLGGADEGLEMLCGEVVCGARFLHFRKRPRGNASAYHEVNNVVLNSCSTTVALKGRREFRWRIFLLVA